MSEPTKPKPDTNPLFVMGYTELPPRHPGYYWEWDASLDDWRVAAIPSASFDDNGNIVSYE